jgi:anthranilate 1,2-dioxygenase small subunit
MERVALSDVMAEYGMALDEDRLEDWVELFDEKCDYRVVTRENVEQGLQNVLIWCDNKDMLRDRVESYRQVNEYNPHYDRHVIGPVRVVAENDGIATFEASYSLFQTDLEGNSRLFSVGRYRVEALVRDGAARLKSVLVVADTGAIPSLLATPI